MSESSATWRTVRFDQIADNIAERVEPAQADTDIYVGLEHLDPDSLRLRRWGTPADVEGTKLRFYPGDVIFGRRRAYQRKLAVAEFEGICSAHAMVLRARPDVCLPEFLPFFLQSDRFFERAMAISVGSLSPTINWKTLAVQEFPLPPLDEQRRIAEILWAAGAVINGYVAVEESLQGLKRAYWLQVSSEADWPVVNLGDIAEVHNGATPRREVERYWTNGTIPWLPTEKVHERLIAQADELITEAAVKECSLKIFPAGSVLISMIGQGKTRGTVARLLLDACINQNFACAVSQPGTDSEFLFYYLGNSYEELRRLSQGGVQALNCQILKQFPIRLPPIEEQLALAASYREVERRSEYVREHIAKLRSLASILSKQLLSSA
ncbi:restriction endonuclease subunit S [Candidatus Amarolinea aalborgensis]|jgi:type I restriction enzyme S subunit|uniref:restriction endonuclease subunit S n=1 Tax=Candidatus Amarolinea aalborgensis TaxID=2249329 RepID=UPI003BF96555